MSNQAKDYNPIPQNAPGAAAAIGHKLENSIPLSIFPISTDKFCICLCGLPGRGKTHIARRLGRYLEFFHAVPVFLCHIADYRRRLFGAGKQASWFDPINGEGNEIREKVFEAAIKDVEEFFEKNANGVVILDLINETHAKRNRLHQILKKNSAKTLWLEVVNNNESFIQKQIKDTVISSPDYEGVDGEYAEKDYSERLTKFDEVFEPIDKAGSSYSKVERHWSYIKCDYFHNHFVIHNIKGYYLFQKVVNFIMNLRSTTTSHAFYLSRHGQSEYNALGRIGGDSGLTSHGDAYARKLGEYVKEHILVDGNKNVPARLWTSTMRRTKETAAYIPHYVIKIENQEKQDLNEGESDKDSQNEVETIEWVQMKPRAWHHLDELFAGDCDGMTYEEIEQKFPEEWTRRSVDKLAYRYPRGESYLDVIARLEPIIIEMERHEEPLLIIAHQGILRIIYAFYMGLSRSEAPYVSIPLNTVVKLVPGAFNCTVTRTLLYCPHGDLPSDGQNEPCKIDDPPSH